ncbi:hypothetical protein ACWJKQ_20855, partial [Xanthomonas axonopodis pv. cassiae]
AGIGVCNAGRHADVARESSSGSYEGSHHSSVTQDVEARKSAPQAVRFFLEAHLASAQLSRQDNANLA